jgi:hypothetical protein
MASPTRKRDCPIAGCGRPSRRFSRYCSTHDQRQQRNGHPEQPTVTSKRYRPYIAAAEKCVGMHEEHPTTAAALALAEAFMGYRAQTPVTVDQRLQGALTRLRENAIAPRDMLVRATAFALFTERHSFKSDRAEAVALGRLLLHAAPARRGFRYRGTIYAACGYMARDYLMPYAMALTNKVQRDLEAHRALVKQSTSF